MTSPSLPRRTRIRGCTVKTARAATNTPDATGSP